MRLPLSPAVAHDFGLLKARDPTLAFKHYMRGALRGDPAFQFRVAMAYRVGSGAFAPDEHKSFIWMHRAASSGYKEAQFEIVRCHVQGLGTPVDETAALSWSLRWRTVAPPSLAPAYAVLQANTNIVSEVSDDPPARQSATGETPRDLKLDLGRRRAQPALLSRPADRDAPPPGEVHRRAIDGAAAAGASASRSMATADDDDDDEAGGGGGGAGADTGGVDSQFLKIVSEMSLNEVETAALRLCVARNDLHVRAALDAR